MGVNNTNEDRAEILDTIETLTEFIEDAEAANFLPSRIFGVALVEDARKALAFARTELKTTA